MKSFSPKSAQLNKTLEHISYEIEQITDTLFGTNNTAIDNALVEARLIHIRALLDFFQKPNRGINNRKELDDVLSSDYGFSHRDVGIPSSFSKRLNKDLAHLTYSRANHLPEDKSWPHDKVVLPMLVRCREFGEHLISNYLPINCPSNTIAWQKLVDKIKRIQGV